MKISVCIPTYNQAAYLEGCIKSVLSQTMQPMEIIVSNDASTDNTEAVLNKMLVATPLLKVIHQPKNIGITANVNACFQQAKGDYILRLDSDDMLLPGYLSSMCALLNQYPAAGYAHCAVQEIDDGGKNTRIRDLFRKEGFESGGVGLQKALKGYRVAANIILFRREALQETGFMQCPYNFAEDYYLAADIAAHGYGNVYTPSVLAAYRVWYDQGYKRMKRKLEEILGLYSVFNSVIAPAFKERGLSILAVDKAKEHFAIAQADCISLKVYNKAEKKELKAALLTLSSSAKTRLVIAMYEHKLHYPFAAFNHIKNKGRVLAKKMIKGLNTA